MMLPDFETITSELLEKADGLCIGEEHWTRSVPHFLIDKLPFFYNCGVRTLYSEYIHSQNNEALQVFLDNPTNENLTALRDAQTDKARGLFSAIDTTYAELFLHAHKLGMRVVGIDQFPRPQMFVDGKLEDHPKGHIITNHYWVEQINNDRRSRAHGKYLVHGGNLHMKGLIPPNSNYVPQETVPKLLSLPYVSVALDFSASRSLRRVMGELPRKEAQGNEVVIEQPDDKRYGNINVFLSMDYVNTPAPNLGIAPRTRAFTKTLDL